MTPSDRLQDKVALITGASSGIGEECAHALAREGAQLILCSRSEEKLKEVARAIEKQYGIETYSIGLDVQDGAAVARAIASLPHRFATIDILLNNAGLALGLEPLYAGEISDWNQMIDTNLKGTLHVTRAVLPAMVERGKGHIIMMGSTAGHVTYPGGNVYCATKHAVVALAHALRKDLKGTRIRVTTIDPGAVETNFSIIRFKGNTAKADSVYAKMEPLTPADVATAVTFAATQPERVNIEHVILTATDQEPLL